MATASWEQHFTCKWINEGRLDMFGFPKDMPSCLKLYLTSIRSDNWTAALEMIQDGEGHCFANEAGIVFPVDYESSSTSSSEGEQPSKGPLPEDEVAFFAGCFSKDRVKKSVFFNIVKKCLEERRKQCKCDALDGEKQFLEYREKTFPGPRSTVEGLKKQRETAKRKVEPRNGHGVALSPQKERTQLKQKKTKNVLADKEKIPEDFAVASTTKAPKETVDELKMMDKQPLTDIIRVAVPKSTMKRRGSIALKQGSSKKRRGEHITRTEERPSHQASSSFKTCKKRPVRRSSPGLYNLRPWKTSLKYSI